MTKKQEQIVFDFFTHILNLIKMLRMLEVTPAKRDLLTQVDNEIKEADGMLKLWGKG